MSKIMQDEDAFKKILVPADGSVPSVIAQELAASFAKKFESKVTVIHVVAHELMKPHIQQYIPKEPEYVPLGTAAGSPPTSVHTPATPTVSSYKEITGEINDWYRQKGKQAITEALAFFKEQHIPADQKIIENADPAETIIQEAQKGNYDLIVLGYSGHEEEEPHLGSITVKVSRHAHAPVLIARERRRMRKILVPVDGSESAERALRNAALIASKTNAKITLLYVQESSIHKLKPEIAKGIGTNILAKAADLAKETKLDQKLESGDPAKVIIQTARDGDYDLIVIGNKGHSTISRFLLGSVSDHVIHYTDRSVLLVR